MTRGPGWGGHRLMGPSRTDPVLLQGAAQGLATLSILPSVPLWGPSSARVVPHMGSGPRASPGRLPQMALPAVWPWARHLPSLSMAYLYPSAPVSSPAQGAALTEGEKGIPGLGGTGLPPELCHLLVQEGRRTTESPWVPHSGQELCVHPPVP